MKYDVIGKDRARELAGEWMFGPGPMRHFHLDGVLTGFEWLLVEEANGTVRMIQTRMIHRNPPPSDRARDSQELQLLELAIYALTHRAERLRMRSGVVNRD